MIKKTLRCFTLVQVILITLAAGMVCLMIATHLRFEQMKTWESTEGMIDEVYSKFVSSPTVASANDMGSKKVSIKYRYFSKGITYHGDKAILLGNFYFPENLLSRLSTGKIDVYVNPKNPKHSILSREYPLEAMILLSVLLLVSLFLGIYMKKIADYLLDAAVTNKY